MLYGGFDNYNIKTLSYTMCVYVVKNRLDSIRGKYQELDEFLMFEGDS